MKTSALHKEPEAPLGLTVLPVLLGLTVPLVPLVPLDATVPPVQPDQSVLPGALVLLVPLVPLAPSGHVVGLSF